MKLLVLGFDGVDFRTYQEHFPAFFNKWDWQCLSDCPSDYTPAAWTTFATGIEPEEHGVGVKETPRPGYCWSSKDIEVASIIKIANVELDKSIGLGHLPVLTMPARACYGWMMSGDFVWPYQHWPSNIVTKNLSCPQDNRLWTNYVRYDSNDDITDAILSENAEHLAEFILDRMILHNRRFQYALKELETDITVLYWHGTDLAGHHLYYDHATMRAVYGKMNNLINEYMNKYQPDNVIVVSDHGMGPAYELASGPFVKHKYKDYWLWERPGGTFVMSGCHRKSQGIFMAKGPDIRNLGLSAVKSETSTLAGEDSISLSKFPTILRSMG